MNEDNLIVNQQLKIEEYREIINSNRKTKEEILNRFYGIGQPLNDNVLKFNNNQLFWADNVAGLVKNMNFEPLHDGGLDGE